MPLGTLGLAFLAGILSVLSPCVLPLVPIVLGTAASEHRLGPLALAGGLAISFTTIGLFVATIGFAMGLDSDLFRTVSAILLIGVGLLLLVPRLQEQFAVAAGPVSQWAGGYLDNFAATGLAGQFGLGLLLGAVWSPCVGPTLGAASLLAAKGENLGQVALTMLAFGIGAALPLMLLGFLSREAMQRWRGRLLEAGKAARRCSGPAAGVRPVDPNRPRQAARGSLGRRLSRMADQLDDPVLTGRLTARVRYPNRDNRASFHADSSAGTAGRCDAARTPWDDTASAPDASSPPLAACRPSSDCTARKPW